MQNKFMELVEQSSMKAIVPKFEIGDTVDVHVRILEGEKERIQIFNGVVIARSGTKTREMFVVRRIVQGEGVERKFPVHSPRIADIVVKRSGKVRRAKLYYLRDRSGKAVRLKERFPASTASPAEAKAAKAERRAARSQRKVEKAERAAKLKAEAASKAEAGPGGDSKARRPARIDRAGRLGPRWPTRSSPGRGRVADPTAIDGESTDAGGEEDER